DHLFCMMTMNHHPLHTNAWFAEHETVQGKNVVVGNLVYSLVLGMSVPDVSGSCIANLEVESLSHKRPTFHGDTIYAETRGVGQGPQLVIGAVLDGVGHEHPGRVQPQCPGLGRGGVDELRRSHEHGRDAPVLQGGDVVHTARRAAASVGQGFDDHVAGGGDL